jgi:hypothetical protein
VKGPLRRTPNRYDLTLYLSSPGTITFDSTKPCVSRIDVPKVPNAFVLTDVLSHSECRQVVSAAECTLERELESEARIRARTRTRTRMRARGGRRAKRDKKRNINIFIYKAIGFTGDAPLACESVSVLAHNFFWYFILLYHATNLFISFFLHIYILTL